jgi:hypothetical protein
MDRDRIAAWLHLPAGDWPPNHYTLLGLTPGESDAAKVELSVHERMEKLRTYQLSYPEDVTEAMNRLAQALICLTDPVAKRTYDAAEFPALTREPEDQTQSQPAPTSQPADAFAWLYEPPPVRQSADSSRTAPPPIDEPRTVRDWRTAPPPARIEFQSDTLDHTTEAFPETVLPPTRIELGSGIPTLPEPPAESAAPPADRVAAPAQVVEASPSLPGDVPPSIHEEAPIRARKRLGTKRALLARISRTRQILAVWRHTGKYLHQTNRQQMKPAEARDLLHHMEVLRELLRWSGGLLGRAGQPGYLVLSLARQELIVPTLQTLQPSQRQALARDWEAGRDLLAAHMRALRLELRELRRKNRVGRALRAVGIGLFDNPAAVLLVLAIVALDVVFYPRIPIEMWQIAVVETVGLLAIFAGKAVWSWWAYRPIRVPVLPSAPSVKPRSGVKRASSQRSSSPGVKANMP